MKTYLALFFFVLFTRLQKLLALECPVDNGYKVVASATASPASQTLAGLQAARVCSNQCMADPCCMAYGLNAVTGVCETAAFKSHSMDFVKEGTCTGTCPTLESCIVGACPSGYGAEGGDAYTFFPAFAASKDEITQITFSIHVDTMKEYLNGIAIRFGTLETSYLNGPVAYTCTLSPGEIIIEATMYEDLLWGQYPVQSGVKFVTSKQVCGPYGHSAGIARTFTGSRLMYMDVRFGLAFDKYTFFFEEC